MLDLSIVIPTYNEEELLPKLLKSIKQQSQQPKEVIVADAFSTDRTREIAKEFGAIVVDGGMPAVGRNRGAEVATGKYIFFLDADVAFENAHFFADAFRDVVTNDYGISSVTIVPVGATRLDEVFVKIYNFYIRLVAPIAKHISGCCMIAKKTVHDKIGGFDEVIVFCEDQDYAQRASAVSKFGYVNKRTRVLFYNRRFERDGRLMTIIRYVLAELHILLLGPIKSDIFRYRFGYKKKS